MSRLSWDETGKRKYENGISHAVLYTEADNKPVYNYVSGVGAFTDSNYRTYKITFDTTGFSVKQKEGTFYYLSSSAIQSEVKPDFPESVWCTETVEDDGITYYSYREVLGSFTNMSSDEEKAKARNYFGAALGSNPNYVGSVTSSGWGRSSDSIVYTVSCSLQQGFNNHAGISSARLVYVYLESGDDRYLEKEFNFFDGPSRIAPKGQYYKFGNVWNGITSVSENPDGAEPNDMWADNMKYASPRSKESISLTVEAYTYPDQFSECDGSKTPVDGVKLGQQTRKQFGISYRTEMGSDSDINSGDNYLLHIVYNCTASPSDRAYETINDSPDAVTFSWEVSSTPLQFLDSDLSSLAPVSSIIIDSSKMDGATSSIGNRSFCSSLENLHKLEDILYGTDETQPALPSPDIVLKCFECSLETPVEEPGADSDVPVEISG